MHIGASIVTKVFLFRQSAEKKYEVTSMRYNIYCSERRPRRS